MKVRLLHLADVHLGCKNFYLADKARQRSEEFKAAFRDSVEYALDDAHAIDGVLIAGNLFEYHRPDAELWSFAKGLISRLLAKERLVAMIPGHEDSYAYKNSVYRTERLPGVELFLNTAPEAPRVRDVCGTRVYLYGMAFVPGQTPTPLPAFQRVPEQGLHIGLLHGCVTGHPEYIPRPHQLDLEVEGLQAIGLDYLALGGYGSFTEYGNSRSKIVYPGCLEGRGFDAGDLGEKGPVVVEFDAGGVHLEPLVTNRKTISKVRIDLRGERITDANALRNSLDALRADDAIAEVTLTGTAEFVADLDEVCEEVRDGFHHFELIDETRIVDSALLRKVERENTIRGYFVRKLGERLEAVKARIVKQGQTEQLMRELAVLEMAMKIGVEQFIEEEVPEDSVYSMIPDSDEMVAADVVRDTVGVNHLEEHVKEMIEYRKKLSRENEPRDQAAARSGAREAAAGMEANGNGNGNGARQAEENAG